MTDISMTSSAPASRPPVSASRRREGWNRRLPLLPAMAFVLVVTQIPFVLTLYYSVQSWNMVSLNPPRLVWFRNFIGAFGDAVFLRALANTAIMTGSIVALSLLVGGLLALGLNRAFWGRGLARTLAITPFFLMPVAAALFWKTAIYDANFGLLGWATWELGLGRVGWLTQYPKLSIILVTAWQWSAFALLILLAGLQSFPEEVREAAAVDGASRLYVFRRLELPHLRPFIELTGLLTAMYVLENFAAVTILTGGGPAYATTNLSYYVYLQAFSAFDLGRASAYAIVTLVIAILLVSPLLRVVSGLFKEGGR
ncbi:MULTISPECIES: carbohydrate ABC transporter permease [unclassified Aureimonas]|uniref:carbohydrate ABC transporter permease n=1 Tax=unclassified Aureimonas TaxID=2615206 RepID=UPI0006FBB086|nr:MULTISPECIES: sugar ABC transporter permease [unclassified Aureimonas]KQT63311.1 sugar ABC transporter permease [Aureimonas sp. Leaf427]KQT80109.1 sugar ABC transporter permease [Aureimonas sp. Leaf460]